MTHVVHLLSYLLDFISVLVLLTEEHLVDDVSEE
jgi:hypothetical protein